jgi:RNA polymerase sigma factor (sigma-70 family)
MVNRGAGGILGPLSQVFHEGTVAGLTDAQLLERYATLGDDAAFEALLTRYGPMVLGVCRRRLRDGHAAEDAFQATFLVLVRKASSIRVNRSIGPWIHGVAWRVAERARVESARRRDREVTGQAVEQAEARRDPQSTRRELAEVFDEELQRLPDKYRVPVVLCHLEGLTHEEASQRLGCPVGTVSIRLTRAHARLRDRLARRGSSPMALAMLKATSSGEMTGSAVPAALFDDALRASIGSGAIPPAVARLTEGVLNAMIRSKIRTAAVGLVSMGLIASLAALALATLPQSPKPGKVVNGKVVDDQGKPIPGAEVWLPFGFGASDRTVHAVTDADGRFALPVPEQSSKDERALARSSVWSFAPGHSIGTAGAYRVLTDQDASDVVVKLGRSTDTAFMVIGPDGRPVAGARVEPYYVLAPSTAYEFPPKGMLPSISGVTDAQGRVRLPSMERKGFGKVAVTTEAFGRQLLRLTDKADEPAERTIRLRPVGRVEGRIVASRPELARGVDLYLSAEEELHPGGWVAEGEAHVVSDEQGRFSVPALASGMMRIEGGVDRALPFRLRLLEGLMVRPGDATRLELPLEAAVKVRGIVRSRETKEPLAKATISVGYGTWRQSDTVTTGPDGKFEAFVVPGKVRLQVIVVPDGYVQLGAPWDEPIPVPADPPSFDLPPIDLVKSVPPIAGKLVDGRDRPLSGVQIIAGSGNRRYGFARTDAKGEFKLGGIPPGIELKYEAWTEDEVAAPTEVIREAPLLLRARLKRETIEEAGAQASISARVVDRDGKPVEGAELLLVETVYGPDGQYLSGRQWGRFGTTDAQGWFRKPFALVKGTSYHLIVQPGTIAVVSSEEIRADGKGPVAFPSIVASRLRELSGTVQDQEGRPISGATVFNWGNASPLLSATTGSDGTFRLSGFPQGEAFLFAEASGYRFRGIPLSGGNGPARIVLNRTEGPPSRALPIPIQAIPRPEIAALALNLIAPDIDRVLNGNDREAQARLLEVLTRIDPEAAWEKIRTGDKVWDRDAAKLAVFHAFRKSNPEAARASLALVKSPFYRLDGLEKLYDAMPVVPIGPRKALLNGMIAEARRPENKDWKVYFLKHLARRLADLGETGAARALVEEILAPAKALDAGIGRADSMQAVAEVLGSIDPEAAEALIPKGGDERSRNDMIGSVAEGCAAIDPARAERLFKQYTHQSSEVYLVHACKRMAGVDLPRARRLAASIKSDALRAYALAWMADALATVDPAVASGLLDDSFRAFADSALRGQGGVWSSHSAGVMAASLLPVVERVRPDRLDEFTWRVVSLRWQPRTVMDLTMTIPDSSRFDAMSQAAAMALYLLRYDRDLARQILKPAVDGFLATPDGSEVSWLQWRLILTTLAQLDPARAAEVARLVPDLKESGERAIREQARLTVAKGLVEEPEEVLANSRTWIIDLEILLREDR